MSNQSPYKADDWVKGTVYEISEKLGAFVAVDNKYCLLYTSRCV